jgi:hypothetical protein
VLDTSAVAETVRKANEEGKRLAEEPKSDDSGDGSTPTASPTASPTATVPALTGAGRTASASPGELIDTNEWYLTLPTGKEGSPDTVEGSKLATYHSKFFDLTKARDGIVFHAGADGVTTKNSHYPRSELREMNGSEKASWSNTSGTHVFDVREAFTKLPSAKPEVVGVQIHDAEDDVMQIRLEGKKLMVQYHDGKSEAVLDPDYQLGTPFDTRIVAANGKVDVLYNGEKKAELPLSGSGWYWKVGAYVQSNGSTGDGAGSTGEVVVYKADISHSGASASESPTPPGTGVNAPARPMTASASTSPTRLPFSSGVVPTSTTTAPGVTCSAPSIRGRPTAATRMSASLVRAARSRVREWQTVTVASSFTSRNAAGMPTTADRPMTTASRPSISIPDRRRISMAAWAVAGRKPS